MHLCVDIGNTRSKVAIFDEQNQLLEYQDFTILKKKQIRQFVQNFSVQAAIVATVGPTNHKVCKHLKKTIPHTILLSPQTPIPIKNKYETPQTLGKDRLAAVIGSKALLGKENILVIDAGTCITYDFIQKKGTYLGGNILPGIQMRYQALHQLTARLPLLHPKHPKSFLGKNTKQSIQAGIQYGVLHEMNGFIKQYEQTYNKLQVVITGGDALYFESRLKKKIFAEPKLVLIGLHQILKYNVKNHC